MDIIKRVLEGIATSLNTYLQNLESRSDQWVYLANIMDHVGSPNADSTDKVVMSVYNITRESVVSTYQPAYSSSGTAKPADAFAIVSPPLFLDVHLMFMANFNGRNYADGLALLSRVITYFQENLFFTKDSLPALGGVVDKVTLELENLSPVDVNYVMSMQGTRYLPSAFYKMRMLPFVSTAMSQRALPVAGHALANQGVANSGVANSGQTDRGKPASGAE